jgi:DNA-binding MurR/RpiR family transcriptional regulator
MTSVLDVIAAALPQMPAKLARAARFALDRPERIALESMRSVAEEVGVAAPTMQRLALQLGYTGYEEFRSQFQSELIHTGFGHRASALLDSQGANASDSLANRMGQAVTENLGHALAQLDEEILTGMATHLNQAEVIYVTGMNAVLALADYMVTTGRMFLPGLRLVGATTATTVEAISEITEKDVLFVIGASPYALRSIAAAKYASERGATVLALTDRRSSPLADYAKLILYAPTDSPHYYPSMAVMLTMIELVLATSVVVGDASALERIQHFERLRRLSGAYLET